MWSLNKAAYDLLKAAVVGGLSLVLTRYHEVPEIQSHQGGEKFGKRILGYDSNALYLSTMEKDVLYGRGAVSG